MEVVLHTFPKALRFAQILKEISQIYFDQYGLAAGSMERILNHIHASETDVKLTCPCKMTKHVSESESSSQPMHFLANRHAQGFASNCCKLMIQKWRFLHVFYQPLVYMQILIRVSKVNVNQFGQAVVAMKGTLN